MDRSRRDALIALHAVALTDAVERLVEAGVLDGAAVAARRDAQVRRWGRKATGGLASDLEALRAEARQQRLQASRQGRDARPEKGTGPEMHDRVTRLDEYRRVSATTPPERPHDDLRAAAAALERAHRALGAALAALSLLDEPLEDSPPADRDDAAAIFGPGPELHIRTHAAGSRVVVVVRGEVDVATERELQEALEEAADAGADEVLLDLVGVRFMDSSGISVLLRTHDRMAAPRRLVVVCPPGPVARALTLTGVDRMLPVFPSRAAARGRR